jgi:hypothetical protein
MEIEIKHVNFFDGQFLQQSEFIEEQLYHIHMRRKMYFVLFEQDGVIPVGAADLTIVPENPADASNKSFHVRAGMAISLDLLAMERKEIILRQDSAVINLNTQGFPAAGPTAWVAIHFEEQGVAIPPSAGDVLGNTRILENAPITVHSADPTGTNAPNGHPFIVLGALTFATMAVNQAQRQTARLRTSLIGSTPTISLSPNTLPPSGVNIDILVTSSGGLNLSTATAASIAFSNPAGIALVSVTNQTANSMTVRLTLTNAAAGPRTMTVTVNAVSASATFTVQAGLQVTSFAGIDQPNGDLLFRINGSGFVVPVQVQFPGGVPAINVPVGNVTSTQIRIPADPTVGAINNLIPVNATSGTVQVISAANTANLDNVTPPAANIVLPATATRNNLMTITGIRLFGQVTVRFTGGAVVGPNFIGAGESQTQTTITLRVPGANATTGQVEITTPGGTVRPAATLVIL